MMSQQTIISPSTDGIMDIKNTFKISTLNTFGLNTTIKQEHLINFMNINDIKILGQYGFKDTNSLFHKNPLPTWHRQDFKSRIDFIWVNYEIIPDLIYALTNKLHIVSTDHSVMTAYFSYDDIFRIKAVAIAKRHNTRKIINYKNEIKSIFKQASAKLPHKKDNLFLEQLPESIKKLPAYANDYKQYDYINSKLPIITDLSYRLNIDKPNILALSILEFKQFVKDLFNIVTIRFKKEVEDYKTERIKFFILINNNGQMELCLDPDVIDKEVTNHFQNAADWIDPRWYANLMQEITIEEWRKVIIDFSKEKASGPSKISNELLQHIGSNIFKFTLQLANLCLIIGDIPTG
ncbi:hypothetical protein RCL_jg14132.t1 [Rhizophagus clarus]|uniref:Uncharacterized protein n=1 Tax=Rhizophagus clarus TaxID=94130 RepID=A0A8H3QW25_9GLOM|nr:hypothetical protein RCL_jg14132.t1 [Rhizophagus clarus]